MMKVVNFNKVGNNIFCTVCMSYGYMADVCINVVNNACCLCQDEKTGYVLYDMLSNYYPTNIFTEKDLPKIKEEAFCWYRKKICGIRFAHAEIPESVDSKHILETIHAIGEYMMPCVAKTNLSILIMEIFKAPVPFTDIWYNIRNQEMPEFVNSQHILKVFSRKYLLTLDPAAKNALLSICADIFEVTPMTVRKWLGIRKLNF